MARIGLARCLVALLVALQLVAGPTVCRASGSGCDTGGEAASECPSHRSDHGDAHDQHHPEDDAGQHGCPEIYLASDVADPAPRPVEGRIPSLLRRTYPSPVYDIPPPVPIA